MKKVNLIGCSLKKLMKNPKLKEAHKRYSGKWNRKRNKLRREIIRKKYWK